MSGAVQRLVLFDIDGTLLTVQGIAREVFTSAMEEVYGVPEVNRAYDFAGKTDLQIVHEIMAASGLEEERIDAGIPFLFDRIIDRMERRLTRETVILFDGVLDLLEILAGREECSLGLLTGNVQRGARMKLAPHGLNRYFSFGAFGNDARQRNQLTDIALERAQRCTGRSFRGKEIVIIGDTPHDIRCGAHLGARSIAVATGTVPYEELHALRPDYIFHDLRPTDAIMEAILG